MTSTGPPTPKFGDANLTDCDREPIHIPGRVQSHGCLLGLDPRTLAVEFMSENAPTLLGLSSSAVMGARVESLLTGSGLTALTELRDTEDDTPRNTPRRFANPLDFQTTGEAVEWRRFDGIIHDNGTSILIELEPRQSPDLVVREMRAGDPWKDLVVRAIDRAQAAEDVDGICEVLVEEIHALTGFDRVMVYRFAPEGHGEVCAEVAPEGSERFLGLRYPASDIPVQARALYLRKWVRLVPDVSAAPSALVPAEHPRTGAPIDLSDAVLRAVSPIHIEYLQNMGVGASMSVSLVIDGELWGMIVCHHGGPHRVSYDVRIACETLGALISAQLGERVDREAAEALAERRRHLSVALESAAAEPEIVRALTGASPAIRTLLDVDSVVVVSGDEVHRGAHCLSGVNYAPIGAHVRAVDHGEEGVHATQCLRRTLEPALEGVAGLLSVELSPDLFVVGLRSEEVQAVTWAGDPNTAVKVAGPNQRLQPRESFAAWKEEVRGCARAWSPLDLRMGAELKMAASSFLVRRNRELIALSRSLESKSKEMAQFLYTVSHDLRSPLVTCQGFVGFLRKDLAEGRTDSVQEDIDHIEASVTSMTAVLDDLLELSRLGRARIEQHSIDLPDLIERLRPVFTHLAADTDVRIELEEPTVAPFADEPSVVRVLENLVGNAIKYACGHEGAEVRIRSRRDIGGVRVSVADDGPGIPTEYQEKIFGIFERLDRSVPGTGIGLASVAKVAELHGGRAGVHSVPGEGAEFWVHFPDPDPSSGDVSKTPRSHRP